ncbi:hypothetical protein [Paracoccus aestuariivivens]|uniref:O-antigen ligase domain-containing protein n=1 Tax=Paracoccus aestuariivivens TaxID=1820333 RepID=A0A6L6J7I0_9RHOB|nr:hypothetical protein [Paracoccus aestuariivivens]MTH77128.1 hypothetical protein [Paracoccus aestuariivivens]
MLPLIALISFPVIVGLLFSRMDWQRAFIWSMLGGYLFLAPGYSITLPGLPILNKPALPALISALMVFLQKDTPKALEPPPPRGTFINVLVVLSLLSPLLTAITNSDSITEGNTFRPGISATFAIGDVMRSYLEILPFLLAYRILWNVEGAWRLVQAMVTGLLVYSFFMWMEVRFSPQMNVWIYGYFQHDFIQTIRYGGYRPIVFLEHPLWVASITLMAFLSAIALARRDRDARSMFRAGYLALLIVICKSAGALLLSIMSAPLLLLARPQMIIRVSLIVGTIAFAYPILRTTSLVPLDAIVNIALDVSVDRGNSLDFRLTNEERLLERAMERPLFGWGGGGRSLFLDPNSGNVSSIPDGLWVIWLGSRGILGYMCHFLMLLGPIWILAGAAFKHRKTQKAMDLLPLACLSMMLATNLIDIIPNATATPITWLIAGTIMGNAQRIAQGISQPETQDGANPEPVRRGLRTVL